MHEIIGMLAELIARIHGGDDSVVEVLEASLLSQPDREVLVANLQLYLLTHLEVKKLVETAKAGLEAKREIQRAQCN